MAFTVWFLYMPLVNFGCTYPVTLLDLPHVCWLHVLALFYLHALLFYFDDTMSVTMVAHIGSGTFTIASALTTYSSEERVSRLQQLLTAYMSSWRGGASGRWGASERGEALWTFSYSMTGSWSIQSSQVTIAAECQGCHGHVMSGRVLYSTPSSSMMFLGPWRRWYTCLIVAHFLIISVYCLPSYPGKPSRG